MLALEMEQALRHLEETTVKLLGTGTADLVALCHALDARANAITKLALITDEAQRGGGSAIERLTAILVQGEEATHRLVRMRREAADEVARLHRFENPDQVSRAIDCAI